MSGWTPSGMRTPTTFSRPYASTHSAAITELSLPPEMPMTSRCARVCSILLARPAVWMEMISSHRSRRRDGEGRKGRAGLKAYSRPGAPGTCSGRARCRAFPAGKRDLLSLKELSERRAASSRSKSTSAKMRVLSLQNRSPSAAGLPLSAMREWPPNTVSVVDSCTPAEERT